LFFFTQKKKEGGKVDKATEEIGLANLNSLEVGHQIHVKTNKKQVLVFTDKGAPIILSAYSNSVAVYREVFGNNKIAPEAAMLSMQQRFGLKTRTYFENDRSFILFVWENTSRN
jgi:hypothetical protein